MKRAHYREDTSLQGRKEEIGEKLARIRNLLEKEGKEGLLLTRHPNFSWITAGGKGFVANCFDSAAIFVLVTTTGLFAICNVIETPRIREEECLEQLGFEIISFGWQEDKLFEKVTQCVSSPEKVIADAPGTGFVAAPEKIVPLRICFTENEIARWIHLGDVMSGALEEYLLTVIPGMTEYEIAGGISQALWKHNIEQVMHLVSADERSDRYRHALPTDKKLEHNLIVSINGRYKGLITTVSRMVYFGKPEEAFLQQYRDCVDMEMETMAMSVIGADEIEMYNTLRRAYEKRGYPAMFDKHGQGGCQGYWPREYMITPAKHGPVRANTAYCFNPVVDGTKSEDAFLVLSDGPVPITRPVLFPKIEYILGGQKYERPDILRRM